MHERLPERAEGTSDTRLARGATVRLSGVRRAYDSGVVALDGLDLDVAPGEFLAVLGPSGCGKSTLLRVIAGLDRPQAGVVEVTRGRSDGRDGSPGADVAYVFQDAHLLPWRNVLANVALPLELLGVDRDERRRAAIAALEQVGVPGDLYPGQLSGGMRMRVSLARALVTRPTLLLLDEPFAALDEITRQRLDEHLREIWMGGGVTVVFVTHSTAEAVFLAQRAVVMSPRPGRIIADHEIDLPANRDGALRGTSAFAAQTRVLYQALERGDR